MVQVSVIVAAWNAEDTIERCANSIVAQNSVETEVIIVNDCSTDQTGEKIERLAAMYPQVISARTMKNSGPSAARNVGLDLARGEWVGIVDADDTIEPNRLAVLLNAAAKNHADICFDNLSLVQPHGREGQRSVLINNDQAAHLVRPWTVESYASFNKPYSSPFLVGFLKPLIKSAFLNQFDIKYNADLYNSEDYLLMLECIIQGAKICYVDHPLYNYYINETSLSGHFNPDAHRKLIVAESELLGRFASALSEREAMAIGGHIESLELAGVTNEIFATFRRGDLRGLSRAVWDDRPNLPIHMSRVVQSIFKKMFRISNRGR